MKEYGFISAMPVWAKGREEEMNVWLEFSTTAKKTGKTVLALTGSSVYSVGINGEFFAFGPARSAHGFYRVDELDLSPVLKDGSNTVSVTVAGYNVNSYYVIDQPSFLCAELIENGKVVAATGKSGFSVREVSEHEQKVSRFSYQRAFAEVYNVGAKALPPVELAVTEPKKYIERGSAYNVYPRIQSEKVVCRGTFSVGDHSAELRYPRQVLNVDNVIYKGYTLPEFSSDPHLLSRNIDVQSVVDCDEPARDVSLAPGEFSVFSMGRNVTGMISLTVTASEPAEILLNFDEILRCDGRLVNFRRMGTTDAVIWRIPAGTHTLETLEPYTVQYAAIYPINAAITVNGMKIIYFGAKEPNVKFSGDDAEMKAIFDAAVETYRQNTFTIYMDCPCRERAGWLCDSFFTSRVEKILTGKSEIEHVFLENFILPDGFRALPEGMLPMCYPGDHFNGNYIPNWAMWYVIELDEYLRRTGDREFVEAAKPKMISLAKFFERYENELGLLEKLDKWVFVEWSKSNELTQDVNFPSNMLYAMMLRKLTALYGDDSYAEKASRIEKTINDISFTDAGFYCDNAVRDESGKLVLSGIYTETCQYYAFFCGTASPETRPELWQRLVSDFGAERVIPYNWPNFRPEAKWQDVYPSNAFIGNYLRLELLYRYGEKDKLKKDIKGFFVKMAKATGTLWESETEKSSLNHGFASHVIYWMNGLGMISEL